MVEDPTERPSVPVSVGQKLGKVFARVMQQEDI